MDNKTIYNKIADILQELCGVEAVAISDKLQDDLGLDSLGLVSMLLMIEERFDITLDESDMNPFDLVTVGDICLLLERYI